jgi:hypothetical protein
LACQKPKDLGYAQELWTTRLLAKHIRKHCLAGGHPQLQNLGRGTVSKILSAHPVKPHKIQYYLERRDPEFKTKMIEVLHVYRDVELWRKAGLPPEVVGVLSYDEKPGIQAISNTAPDLPPVPGRHARVGRDHEYKRHGTVSLLAGIELLSGEVLSSGSPPQFGIYRVSPVGGPTLCGRISHSHRSGQSFRAPIQTNSSILGQRAKPLRIHLHAQTRFVAESC